MAQPMKRGDGMAAGNRGTTMTPAAPMSTSSATWKKADDMTESLGTGMKSLAGTIRQQAPAAGTMGQMASGVAQTLEQTGRYLEKEGLSGVADDVQDMVRQHPLPAMLVCLGVGFLMAQACGRR